MGNQIYTVITFAPVQGFIEKSRKLRDLYGSSYLLSLLSWVICQVAQKQGCQVVSPASIDITQGMPNQIIINGDITEEGVAQIRERFKEAWKAVADSCREWIKYNVTQWEYKWEREWNLWSNHAWEFFAVRGEPGQSISIVRERMNQEKTSRDWTGINWQGESSTLSGADAIAYPHMGATGNPRQVSYQAEQENIREFYRQLSLRLEGVQSPENTVVSAEDAGSSLINVREELSIPELIKRLITSEVILKKVKSKFKELGERWGIDLEKQIDVIAKELNPRSFKDINRHETNYWTGWFQGDGDGAGKYFKSLSKKYSKDEEEAKTTAFSEEMRAWGKDVKENPVKYLQNKGRMIYAGGDDFLGVLYYPEKEIAPGVCFDLMSTFKSKIWHQGKETPKTITASVGFVWAGAQVPQRDVLQHCHAAEQSAKKNGRDRIAFRILFNSGNHLEWVCPWWILDTTEIEKLSEEYDHLTLPASENLIESYRDRNGGKNWTHFHKDVALLESRHAFDGEKTQVEGKWIKTYKKDIALELMEIYFGSDWKKIIDNTENWWNLYDNDELQTFTGILGDPKSFESDSSDGKTPEKALNDWVINLAKVGFYLTEGEKK